MEPKKKSIILTQHSEEHLKYIAALVEALIDNKIIVLRKNVRIKNIAYLESDSSHGLGPTQINIPNQAVYTGH